MEYLRTLERTMALNSVLINLLNSKSYQFTHTTSSPHFPSSNGQAERTVQTVRHLIKNGDDPFTALLSYRVIPLPWCGTLPAELLMGRKL